MLKVERMCWAHTQTAHRDLFEFMEVWYNRQGPSTLGYLSPVAYEASLVSRASAPSPRFLRNRWQSNFDVSVNSIRSCHRRCTGSPSCRRHAVGAGRAIRRRAD